jgi:hypothetical protein
VENVINLDITEIILNEFHLDIKDRSFDQNFYTKFNDEILTEFNEIKESISFDETIIFAQKIIYFSEEFDIKSLKKYGEKLLESLKSFKLREIKKLIHLFISISNTLLKK